ncbi:hypothetical protein NDU88_002112 [Pleurodeles waltl]|uniref:Uncharacterized protein n=1 Tax=Pleurodeles waltl TaxID=8319 RepID=A0AAV7TJN7_PLEWA|nr:hypothetical protein NDU88_002112 [Pleurodeles waltl]
MLAAAESPHVGNPTKFSTIRGRRTVPPSSRSPKARGFQGNRALWDWKSPPCSSTKSRVPQDHELTPRQPDNTAGRSMGRGGVRARGKQGPLVQRGAQSDTTADPAPPESSHLLSEGGASTNVGALGTSSPSPTERAAAARLRLPSQTQPRPPAPAAIGATKGTPTPPGTTAGCTDTSKRAPNNKIRTMPPQ